MMQQDTSQKQKMMQVMPADDRADGLAGKKRLANTMGGKKVLHRQSSMTGSASQLGNNKRQVGLANNQVMAIGLAPSSPDIHANGANN